MTARTSDGSRPIALAEARVLQHVAKEQSPDWADPVTQRQLLGSGQAAELAGNSQALEADVSLPHAVVRAFLGCKKDLLAVALSCGTTGVCAWKVAVGFQRGASGRGWVVIELAASVSPARPSDRETNRISADTRDPLPLQAWALILALVKLAFGLQHRLYALRHPDAPHRSIAALYKTLEKHLIPYYIAYAGLTAFVDLRSVVLEHAKLPGHKTDEDLRIEAAIFAVSTALLLLEFLSPRPSRFASRSKHAAAKIAPSARPSPPELNAPLFSLMTFSHVDGFLMRSAFPKALKAETISAANVPELRPDDKTARVLLSYRQSVRRLDERLASLPRFLRRRILRDDEGVDQLSLTVKLLYHFQSMLAVQISWAILPVLVNGIPPIMLNQILSAIAARQRGDSVPNHVILLYAWVTFVATLIVSIGRSLSLFLGRRICIRLRSIIVGEVFTKALRRKDQAGHSSSADQDVAADGAPTTAEGASIPTIKLNDEGVDENDAAKALSTTEEELDKASSGKIMNLVSTDTYSRASVLRFALSATTDCSVHVTPIDSFGKCTFTF